MQRRERVRSFSETRGRTINLKPFYLAIYVQVLAIICISSAERERATCTARVFSEAVFQLCEAGLFQMRILIKNYNSIRLFTICLHLSTLQKTVMTKNIFVPSVKTFL